MYLTMSNGNTAYCNYVIEHSGPDLLFVQISKEKTENYNDNIAEWLSLPFSEYPKYSRIIKIRDNEHFATVVIDV